jgi:hypothetical protein
MWTGHYGIPLNIKGGPGHGREGDGKEKGLRRKRADKSR